MFEQFLNEELEINKVIIKSSENIQGVINVE